jgi:uncharacterized membrane protein
MNSESSFKLDLQNMDLRLTEMEEKIDAINTKLTQVVDAILGNPLTKTGGFVHDIDILKSKIEELEKKQLRYESFKNRVSWTVGIIMGAAMVLQYVVSIYTGLKH